MAMNRLRAGGDTSPRSKYGRMDIGRDITLDVSVDVSDNKKLLGAVTKNVATMMEQISKQMSEFEEIRSSDNKETKRRFERLEQELSLRELYGQLDGVLGHHRELNDMIVEVNNGHEKTCGKVEKVLESVLGLHSGHEKTSGRLEKTVESLSVLRDGHDGMHGKIKTVEQRLQSVEKNGQETCELLKKLIWNTDDANRQSKAAQDEIKKDVRSEIRALNSLMDFSVMKGWLDQHSRGLHDKLEANSKKHDDLQKVLHAKPDHEALMKGVHGLLTDHLNDHNGKIMSCINKLPLPPNEKVLLQAVENMQEASLVQTLEAIEKLKKQFPDLAALKGWIDGSTKGLHDKLDGHGKKHDNLSRLMDGVPNHDTLMKGVHGLLADHMSDHSGKIMSCINQLPLPADEKVLLQAIENMQEASLGQTLESIEKLKRQTPDIEKLKGWIDGSAKELHDKLDGHGKKHADNLSRMMDGMPDHDTLMKGVHNLLADHMGDHSGKIMSSINRLPLPPDEKVLLQAIENMQEASLEQTLEAIEKLKKKTPDISAVREWIDGSAKGLHDKLDGHRKGHVDNLNKMMDGMPDHDTLMKGVHGLLADHMGDHSGKIMASINKMPLPPDEKVLLQAIENMQEASLGQTLEAIEKLRRQSPDISAVKGWIDGQAKGLHDKLDGHGKKHGDNLSKMMDGMPDHDTLMKGVHGLLADHMSDHSGKIMASINTLPLPPDEKVLLQAIENMQEASLGQTLEAIEKLKKQSPDISVVKSWIDGNAKGLHDKLDGNAKGLHDKLDAHGKKHADNLSKMMDGMPDHDTLMKGVHNLMADHMGDHSGKIMSSINKMPLPPDEKILLQAIENMQEAALDQTLEAIEKLKKQTPDISAVKGWIDGQAKGLHDKLDGHGKKHADNVSKMMTGMPDHDTIMKGVHGLLADHMSDHSGKIMSSINKMPLPPDEKILLQAIENMQEASLGQTLEAIENLKKQSPDSAAVKSWIDGSAKGLHEKLDGHGKKQEKLHAENLAKMMDGVPDHDTLMKGVHGLLADHMGDHSGKIMSSINKMPLPPDEKVLLQAIENMQEASLGQTLEAIEKLQKQSPDISVVKSWIEGSAKGVHDKLDGHGKKHADNLSKMMDGMPDHDTLLKGVHNLLADHMGDHSGKIMSSINKMPLPPDEKILLQAIENMQEAALEQILESIEKIQKQYPDITVVKSWIDGSAKGVHDKLDGHGKKHDNVTKMMDGMPDHDTLMKGVHGLLADHMGDHSGKIMSSINKLPLPPDEKVLLQAIENMQEASLGQTLEAIEKLQQQSPDISRVKGWLDEHAKGLHGKLENHGKKAEDLAKLMGGKPDHDALMKGVHGLLSEHMSDHGGKIMASISKLPLPPDEKVLLQAIEDMQEASLGQTLEAIQKLQADVEGHTGSLHGKADAQAEALAQHVGAHTGKVMDEINKLPLPPDEKLMLQAIESMQESVVGSVVRAVQGLQKNLSDHSGGLADHVGDGHSKIMNEINSLPLPPDEKILLQAMESMEESVLNTILDAIKNIQMNVVVQGGNATEQSLRSAPLSSRTTSRAPSPTGTTLSSPRRQASSFSCRCGYTCGTETALSRHLMKNTGREHGRI